MASGEEGNESRNRAAPEAAGRNDPLGASGIASSGQVGPSEQWETLYEDGTIRLRQHKAIKELHEFINKTMGDLFIIIAGEERFRVFLVGSQGLEEWPVITAGGRRFTLFPGHKGLPEISVEELEEILGDEG